MIEQGPRHAMKRSHPLPTGYAVALGVIIGGVLCLVATLTVMTIFGVGW